MMIDHPQPPPHQPPPQDATVLVAEHELVAQPLLHSHDQVNVLPPSKTAVGVPKAHNPPVGAVVND